MFSNLLLANLFNHYVKIFPLLSALTESGIRLFTITSNQLNAHLDMHLLSIEEQLLF